MPEPPTRPASLTSDRVASHTIAPCRPYFRLHPPLFLGYLLLQPAPATHFLSSSSSLTVHHQPFPESLPGLVTLVTLWSLSGSYPISPYPSLVLLTVPASASLHSPQQLDDIIWCLLVDPASHPITHILVCQTIYPQPASSPARQIGRDRLSDRLSTRLLGSLPLPPSHIYNLVAASPLLTLTLPCTHRTIQQT